MKKQQISMININPPLENAYYLSGFVVLEKKKKKRSLPSFSMVKKLASLNCSTSMDLYSKPQCSPHLVSTITNAKPCYLYYERIANVYFTDSQKNYRNIVTYVQISYATTQ